MMSLPEWREELPPISRDKIRARPHLYILFFVSLPRRQQLLVQYSISEAAKMAALLRGPLDRIKAEAMIIQIL